MNGHGGVLIIDDDPSCTRAMVRALEGAGILPAVGHSEGSDALEKVRSLRPSLVCLDLNLGASDGREILGHLRSDCPDVDVLVVSGSHDVDTALQCIRSGASDYLPKPFATTAFIAAVKKIRGVPDAPPPRDPADGVEDPFAGILTGNPAMDEIFRYARSVARSALPILVTGETGTGKELFAQAIHRLRIPDGPFLAMNTAGLDDPMFADALFGHVAGAFTGADRARPGLLESAGEGTLFLDEIGDLSPASQVKLLRLLQENEFSPVGSDRIRRCRCRFVLATHRDLARTPGFRQDLYWRLCAHRIDIPPLRERRDDLRLLCAHFASEAANQFGKPVPAIPDSFLRELETLEFRGNVRELRGMIHDLVARSRTGRIEAGAIRGEHRTPTGLGAPQGAANGTLGQFPSLAQMTATHIASALERTEGNRTAAAELLGISRQTLITHIKREGALSSLSRSLTPLSR